MPIIRASALTKRPANSAGWRLIVASIALVAFALQSYVTQTHIHLRPALVSSLKLTDDNGVAGKTISGQRTAPKDKAPANDDPLKCPMCQAMGHAGHFVTPSAAALLLPGITVSILPLSVLLHAPRASPSHSWQGRGPPTS